MHSCIFTGQFVLTVIHFFFLKSSKIRCDLLYSIQYSVFSLQAGHTFQQRCAHSAHSHARLQQEAPVFLLLLDCVWQLWRQFPLALGFSEALLLRVATEAYASDYGTFLCNSDQERSVVPQSVNRHFRQLNSTWC